MPTKVVFINGIPSATTGSDVANNGPLSPAQVDQNFRNLQSSVDALAAAQTTPQSGNYTITPLCSTSGSITVSNRSGRYTKRDDMCKVQGYFTVGSVASPLGHIRVNLPFPAADGAVPSFYSFGLTSAAIALAGEIYGGELIILESAAGTVTSTSAQRLQAGAEIHFSLSYFLA